MTEEQRVELEAKCQRRVVENLHKIGLKIGPRTRMLQIILENGVVAGLRGMRNEDTSGWNDLYVSGLLGLSVEATIVESASFRKLFELQEIGKMEEELRASGYEPKPPA
jgi:hypothetical protein